MLLAIIFFVIESFPNVLPYQVQHGNITGSFFYLTIISCLLRIHQTHLWTLMKQQRTKQTRSLVHSPHLLVGRTDEEEQAWPSQTVRTTLKAEQPPRALDAREQRQMGSQGHPLREEAWVQAWTAERSPIPESWGEKPLRQRWQLEQRTRGWKRKKEGQLCQCGLCSELKSERLPDGYLAGLDLLMWLYAMRFSLLLTWLQELLNPAASLVHVFHCYHDPCFNNLLIFSIPRVFILSLQQHIF